MANEAVQVWRIFSRPDGISSMEPVEVSMDAAGGGAGSRLFGGPGVSFRRLPHDLQATWHCAPRRQFFATISGEGEVETGDGQVLVVRPGVVTLLEDLQGVGHLTRGRGGEDRLCLVIPLDADTVVG